MLSQSSAQQQYADGGQGSLSRGEPRSQPQSVIHSYQEQRIFSETQQMPANMSTSHSAPPSDPSSLSSQLSNKSTGGKHVRVLDASGRDVQVHAALDGTDLRQERASVQQSQLQPASSAPVQQTATSSSTDAYNELEDIMASMSEFDVSC